MTLKPVTDGNRTFWHWESTFATPPGRERELREMVAQGVYEAGFDNLRRHLQQGGDLRAARQRARCPRRCRCRRAALPYAATAGRDELKRARRRRPPRPAPGEVRIRQRAIGVNFIDVYLRRGWIPACWPRPACPGMEAAGTRARRRRRGVSGVLPGDRVAYLGPLPGAYRSVRSVPADWVVRLPAGGRGRRRGCALLKGLTADYLLRDLGRVSPARACWCMPRPAASACWCARGRAASARPCVGTVSSEAKARRRARTRLRARDRDARLAFRRSGAALVRRRRRASIDGLGAAARDENLAALARRGHWISLGQASGALGRSRPNALVAKSITFSRPVVFDYVATRSALQQRAARFWAALADGTSTAADRALFARSRPPPRTPGSNRARTMGALVLIA